MWMSRVLPFVAGNCLKPYVSDKQLTSNLKVTSSSRLEVPVDLEIGSDSITWTSNELRWSVGNGGHSQILFATSYTTYSDVYDTADYRILYKNAADFYLCASRQLQFEFHWVLYVREFVFPLYSIFCHITPSCGSETPKWLLVPRVTDWDQPAPPTNQSSFHNTPDGNLF